MIIMVVRSVMMMMMKLERIWACSVITFSPHDDYHDHDDDDGDDDDDEVIADLRMQCYNLLAP